MGALAAAARGLRVATMASVGSARGWLDVVVARHAAWHNGRCTSMGAFSTAGAC